MRLGVRNSHSSVAPALPADGTPLREPQNRASAPRNRWWILGAIGLGSLVSGIDSSVTNTVLPVISTDFHTGLGTIEWVLMGYLLAQSALLLTMGRLGDLTGHRRVYLGGMGIFLVASIICGAAPNDIVLIIFRAVQGCGAAMMGATGVVIITQAFGTRDRGKGIGLMIGITYFGLSAGPAVGGLLAGAFSWRAVFFINVPICIAGLIVGLRILPAGTQVKRRVSFDVRGAVTSVIALTSLLLALSHGDAWGWTSPVTIVTVFVALAAGVLFVAIELERTEPMLELRLFRNRLFTSATSSAMLNYTGTFFSSFLLPFYLVQARGFPVNTAGLLLIASPVVMAILAPLSGRLSDRVGSRLPCTAGMVFCTIGLVALAFLRTDASIAQILLSSSLIGLGSGLFTSPNTSTIMGAVETERQGTAAGVQAVARNVGMVFGIALAGAIFSARLSALGGQSHFVPAFHDTLLVGAAIMLVGAILSSTRGTLEKSGTGKAVSTSA